jgi:hypothetical protein
MDVLQAEFGACQTVLLQRETDMTNHEAEYNSKVRHCVLPVMQRHYANLAAGMQPQQHVCNSMHEATSSKHLPVQDSGKDSTGTPQQQLPCTPSQ